MAVAGAIVAAVVVGQAGAGAFVRVPEVVRFVFAQREARARILFVFGRGFEADVAEVVLAAEVADFVVTAVVVEVNKAQGRLIVFEW